MPCGSALYFDDETDAAIRGLWQSIEEAGLHSGMYNLNFPPHLSLLVCEDTDMDGVRVSLPPFIALQPPIPIQFHSLGVFYGDSGVIYLAPIADRPLLELHAQLWDLIAPHTQNPSDLYRPGQWVPHVTLDLDVPPEQVGAIVDLLRKAPLPRRGLINAVFIAEFGDQSENFNELFQARLGSAR